MSERLSEATVRKADSADLVEYAKSRGYTLKLDGSDYRVVGYGGLLIDAKTRNRWYHHSQGKGGGSVQFLMHMENMTWKNAVLELAGENRSVTIPIIRSPVTPPQKPFELPKRADNNNRVITYLSRVRGIDEDVIRLFIKEGKLYQDTRGNCVFLSFSDGKPAHAFLRTTDISSSFRRDVGEKIGWGIGRTNHTTLYVFESPIDIMSYLSLKKQRGERYSNAAYISLGGVAPKVLYRCLDKNPQINNVVICTDNDKAGNAFFESRQPELERLNINVRRECPVHKDFNDDLLAYYGEVIDEYEHEP